MPAWVFKHLQGQRLHNLSSQPVPVSHHSQSKKVFPDVQMEFSGFRFAPIASCSVSGHHWQGPGSLLFIPSLHMFIHIGETPLSPLFSSLNSPSSLSLSLCARCFPPLTAFAALCWTCSGKSKSSVCGGAQCWTQHSRGGLSGNEGWPPSTRWQNRS